MAGESRTEGEEILVEVQRRAIEEVMKDFPLDMAAFTPDQTAEEGGSAASVYIPEYKEYVKLTNISAKAFRIYFRAGFAHEIARAKREKRRFDPGRAIDNGLYLNAQQQGWGAKRYNEVAVPLGPLRPAASPGRIEGWLRGRRLRKQGD